MADSAPQNSAAEHWQRVYAQRQPDEVSWFQRSASTSLELIEAALPPPGGAVLDVGGGASPLAGELLDRGYRDVTVADISGRALERARAALDARGGEVTWAEADVRDHDFGREFDLWHDRALFHFMVEEADREGYLRTLRRSLRRRGHIVLATFGPDGPTACSGLPVRRYDAGALATALGGDFELLASRTETHVTPRGAAQQFVFALLRAAPACR